MQKVWVILLAIAVVLIAAFVLFSLRPQPVSGLALEEDLIPVITSPLTDDLTPSPVGQSLQDPGLFSGQENGANLNDAAVLTPDELHQLDLEGF